MKKHNRGNGGNDDKTDDTDKPALAQPVYLDANSTTYMNEKTVQTMVKWTNRGNPSSSYQSAQEIRNMFNNFRKMLADRCGFKCVDYKVDGDYANDADDRYVVVFTSCASESNNLVLRSVSESYNQHVEKPHFVVSAVEHRSLLDCARHLEAIGQIELTLVKPDALGFVEVAAVERAIRENTALIAVMQANNETGCINDIAAIGAAAHKRNIPFHTDCVQMFGKFPLNPIRDNVDSFAVSFHKCYGPPGVGALVIRRKFLHGYRLCAEITGSQQYHLRGGTENTPGIAASFMALKQCWDTRDKKNAHLLSLKRQVIEELPKLLPCKTYREYLEIERTNGPKYAIEVVFLSTAEKSYLPNTLMMSIVKRSKNAPEICNVEIKKRLEAAGVIVSIGSACSTSDPKASHVLYSMDVSEHIRKGVLRVSFSDDNTREDVQKFIVALVDVLKHFNT